MTDYCHHQGRSSLVRTKIADGSWQVRKLCGQCRQPFGSAVNQRTVQMDALDEFVLGYTNPCCAVCGHPDTQLHHWFPQALARKAGINPDGWPTAYLCSTCHDLWHRIVTPALLNRPEPKNRARREWEAPKP